MTDRLSESPAVVWHGRFSCGAGLAKQLENRKAEHELMPS